MITDEIEKYLLKAIKVDFLKKKWEFLLYAQVLMEAEEWGAKKDLENKLYFSKNHLIDKYNV